MVFQRSLKKTSFIEMHGLEKAPGLLGDVRKGYECDGDKVMSHHDDEVMPSLLP